MESIAMPSAISYLILPTTSNGITHQGRTAPQDRLIGQLSLLKPAKQVTITKGGFKHTSRISAANSENTISNIFIAAGKQRLRVNARRTDE
jgi:hypothetical protein